MIAFLPMQTLFSTVREYSVLFRGVTWKILLKTYSVVDLLPLAIYCTVFKQIIIVDIGWNTIDRYKNKNMRYSSYRVHLIRTLPRV